MSFSQKYCLIVCWKRNIRRKIKNRKKCKYIQEFLLKILWKFKQYRRKSEKVGQLGARHWIAITTKQKMQILLFSASQKTEWGKSIGLKYEVVISLSTKLFQEWKADTEMFKTSVYFSNRSKKWAINTRRTDLIRKDAGYLYRNIRICSAHFEDEMFTTASKKCLKTTAVPTLFELSNAPPTVGVKRRLLQREETGITSKHILQNI